MLKTYQLIYKYTKLKITIRLNKTKTYKKQQISYVSMVLSFILNDGKVLANLKSYGKEFHIIVPRYAKLFCLHFVFNCGGLRFRFELRSVLFVTAEMLLKAISIIYTLFIGFFPRENT